MATLVFNPSVPANDKNYAVPSRISAWWRTICPDGSLDSPIELGSISDVEFTPNETTVELDSARNGVLSTTAVVVTKVSGTVTFKIHEMVGSNLNLLFRPISTASLTGVTGELLFGQDTVNLDGTIPTAVGLQAVDNNSDGTIAYKDVTVIRVESPAIVDPATGRGTQYTELTDYTFTQATAATVFSLSYGPTLGGAADPVAGETITGQAFVDFSSSDVALPVAFAATFNALATSGVFEFTAATGALSIGDIVGVLGANDAPIVGYVYTTGTTDGIIWTGVSTNGDVTTLAGAQAMATVEGWAGTTAAAGVVLPTFTSVASAATTPTTVSSGAGLTGGSVFVTATTGVLGTQTSSLAFVAAITGNMGSYTDGVHTLVLSGAGAAAAAALTVATNNSGADSLTVTETVVGVLAASFRNGMTLTTNVGAAVNQLLASESAGGGTQATLTRVTTGAVTDGQAVVFCYSYRRDGSSYSILDGVVITGQLQLQILSQNGPQNVYVFNKVNLKTDGAISYNPEERVEPTLMATILPDANGNRGHFTLLSNFTSFALSNCA